MMPKKKPVAQFIACLKGSTPSAKPIKFGAEGEADITFETDCGEMAQVIRLLQLVGKTFKVTIEEES